LPKRMIPARRLNDLGNPESASLSGTFIQREAVVLSALAQGVVIERVRFKESNVIVKRRDCLMKCALFIR